MKRRTFSKVISISAPGYWLARGLYAQSRSSSTSRIAMSTVNFRERFQKTRSEVSSYQGRDFTLADIPNYFADRFGLSNVEFWSRHFESTDPDYLTDLKQAIKKNKSTLINIQCDEEYQLGDPDPAKRKQGLDLAFHWLGVADTLESNCIRFNPGQGEPDLVIKSLKALNEVARAKGIVLMIENHFGIEMDPMVHLNIVKSVGDNIYTLPDYGNYSDEARYKSLEMIMPYAYQVSAKSIEFDEEKNHLSFDFDRCMRIAVDSGFTGIYSVEQWSPNSPAISDEEMADWMIERVKSFVI